MLYVIGIGLSPQQMTLEAVAAVKKSRKIYLENYTSAFASGTRKQLEKILHKKITVLTRKQVEEEFTPVLSLARKKTVALLVYGNPLFATTHIQLILDAQAKRTPITVIPGISIVNYVGATGLDAYKFGRTATVVFQEPNYSPHSFFDIIEKNSQAGLHSLCLLDIRTDENRFMTVTEAIAILRKIADFRNSDLIQNTVLIGLYGVGGKNQRIRIENPSITRKPIEAYPQSLIVCGKLNPKEQEAIELFRGKKR